MACERLQIPELISNKLIPIELVNKEISREKQKCKFMKLTNSKAIMMQNSQVHRRKYANVVNKQHNDMLFQQSPKFGSSCRTTGRRRRNMANNLNNSSSPFRDRLLTHRTVDWVNYLEFVRQNMQT